jgi:hypothetical protein
MKIIEPYRFQQEAMTAIKQLGGTYKTVHLRPFPQANWSRSE